MKNPAGAKVLVADDEVMIRQLTRVILQSAGYKVLLAEDGHEALELYRANMAGITLVILDAHMPGLGGRDTLIELIRLNPHVNVLFSSGIARETLNIQEFPQVRGFLAKPYLGEDLLRMVQEITSSA